MEVRKMMDKIIYFAPGIVVGIIVAVIFIRKHN